MQELPNHFSGGTKPHPFRNHKQNAEATVNAEADKKDKVQYSTVEQDTAWRKHAEQIKIKYGVPQGHKKT